MDLSSCPYPAGYRRSKAFFLITVVAAVSGAATMFFLSPHKVGPHISAAIDERSNYPRWLQEELTKTSRKTDCSNGLLLPSALQSNVSQNASEPPTECNVSCVYKQLYRFRSDLNVDANTECPEWPPNLVGMVPLFRCKANISELEALDFHVDIGGHYRPKHCTPRSKVAIILPFRNRWEHLTSFVMHMHPFLQKQELEYTIFVINQVNDEVFNKGILLNTGATVASRLGQFDCYIFHDIDLLPENDKNLYRCPPIFRHLSVAVDKFGYEMPYDWLVGGVLAADKAAFEKLNGYSNLFFGWGGEDDDLGGRMTYHNLKVERNMEKDIGRYTMIKHERDPGNRLNPERFDLMRDSGRRSLVEGLRSNISKTVVIIPNKLFTLVNVTFTTKDVKDAIHLETSRP